MNETILCETTVAARLRVAGSDAGTFLQGQFTNDLRPRAAQPAVYGLWLNQKGRVLADSYVLRRTAGACLIMSTSSPAQTIRERLEAYIIADDVQVEEESDETQAWIVSGIEAAADLARVGIPTPPPGEFAEWEGALVLRARVSRAASWMIVPDGSGAHGIKQRLERFVRETGARAIPTAELAVSRILAGIPEIPGELGSRDLPNEGGLEHEAISYTKGCYLGQEVMARLHSMGQVRRRLYIVRWRGGHETPEAGTPLHARGRVVGELRSLVRDAGAHVGLAMLQRDFVEVGGVVQTAGTNEGDFLVLDFAAGRAW